MDAVQISWARFGPQGIWSRAVSGYANCPELACRKVPPHRGKRDSVASLLKAMLRSSCLSKLRKNWTPRRLPTSSKRWQSRAWPSRQEQTDGT
jgi:hypothetical protein